MKGNKVWIVAAILIIACFLLYIFLPGSNQTLPEEESVSVVSNIKEEQAENPSVDTEVEEEEPQEEDTTQEQSVAETFKEKVREMIEGAISFFRDEKKIVAIGDSLTEGVGDETESGGYVGILNHTFEDQNINISIENLGKRGNRTDQLLVRLENEEIASSIKDADIVLITIGANDIMKVVRSNYTNLNLEPFAEEKINYVERLRAIFTKMNEINPDMHIYLIGFYNPFERVFGDIEQLNLILDNWNFAGELVTEEFENVSYIPTKDLFHNATVNLLADDNFHPNTSGYKLMAERVLEYLDDYQEEAELPNEETETETETETE
ncbi:SGNH/GDSL hydrolase family protein [Bacillus sp. PS06]|uniref:SGNH/GDSL hydrolase family protein n=1 Tax=Bacillus sp. PS06 TaxID=2764176 RepID=UPI00177AF833|nr:SGNH/GDSL hydrolase family protein [Bacillus sp. PS06]MBD8068766.1 SGNH/GDSL hydrolase family protein [Bacillus sp. PS06]